MENNFEDYKAHVIRCFDSHFMIGDDVEAREKFWSLENIDPILKAGFAKQIDAVTAAECLYDHYFAMLNRGELD